MTLGLIVPIVWPTLESMLVTTVIRGVGFGCFQAVDHAPLTQVLQFSSIVHLTSGRGRGDGLP